MASRLAGGYAAVRRALHEVNYGIKNISAQNFKSDTLVRPSEGGILIVLTFL